VMVKRLRLHLGRVEDELRDVQRHFPAINAVLNLRRDDFSRMLKKSPQGALQQKQLGSIMF